MTRQLSKTKQNKKESCGTVQKIITTWMDAVTSPSLFEALETLVDQLLISSQKTRRDESI